VRRPGREAGIKNDLLMEAPKVRHSERVGRPKHGVLGSCASTETCKLQVGDLPSTFGLQTVVKN
jgi:hypothetical protein